MSASSVGPTNYKVKLVNIGDTADIQIALNNIVYGTNSTPATSGDIGADSLYGNLANKVSPTFTGTVTLPSTTSIGNVSSTEIGYLDGVTSSVQTQLTTNATNISAIGLPTWFGDGSDGTVTISSGTTTLTRDMYYDTLTISGTGKLDPAGFRIFVKTTLDLSNAGAGAISHTASDGSNASGSAGGSGGSGSTSTTSYYGRSTSGTNGRTGGTSNTTLDKAGYIGTTVTADSPIFYANWIPSVGGIATGSTGSLAQTLATASTTSITWRRAFVDLYAPFISGTLYCGAGGNGGNGGPYSLADNETGGGGGGGGAGNIGCFIYAKNIKVGTSTADSAIKFTGGVGGNGSSGTSGVLGGGGGGGQGGIIYLVYKTTEGSMTAGRYLVDSSGGNGGTGYRGGQGGASGSIAMINLVSGTMTVYAATAGAVSTNSTAGVANSNKRNLV